MEWGSLSKALKNHYSACRFNFAKDLLIRLNFLWLDQCALLNLQMNQFKSKFLFLINSKTKTDGKSNNKRSWRWEITQTDNLWGQKSALSALARKLVLAMNSGERTLVSSQFYFCFIINHHQCGVCMCNCMPSLFRSECSFKNLLRWILRLVNVIVAVNNYILRYTWLPLRKCIAQAKCKS